MKNDEKIISARKELGQFIAQRRAEMGRTTKELADHVGLTANTMQRIEEGRFPWDIDTLHRICAALELKPFYVPHELLNENLEWK